MTKEFELEDKSSMRYENLYSILFQELPIPFAAGIGFSGSIGLIGLAFPPGISTPMFLGDPLPPVSYLL